MNKKNLLALFMAFTFFIGSLSFTKSVEAASGLVLNHSFTKKLVEGANSVPTQASGTGENNVFLSFNMANINGTDFNTGTFNLEYPLDDNEILNLKVEKTSTSTAKVTYEIKNSSGTVITPAGYEIYTHLESQYVPLASFLANGYNSSEANYKVLDSGVTAGTSPTFLISPDRGFSIKYNNRNIHFKWNSATKEFQLYTSGIKQGNIYDVKLSLQVGSNTYDTTKKLSSGISTITASSTPTANTGKTVKDILNQNIAGYTDDLDPGSDEVGLILSFDVPREYDTTTNTFSKIPTDYKIPTSVTFLSTDTSQEFMIKFADISASTISMADVTVAPNNSLLKSVSVVSGRISAEITGLKPGIIFNSVTFSADSDTTAPIPLEANKSAIKNGKVFTFPKYKIVNRDNRYYLQLTPFAGFKGEYLLKAGNPLTPSILQKTDGSTIINFPLTINSTNQFDEVYQVFFSQGMDFQDVDAVTIDTNIYSQILHYKPLASSGSVSAPNNFKVVDYSLLPLETATDNEEGTVQVKLRWDMGIVANVNKLLDANGGSTEIVYSVQKAIKPEKDDLAAFTEVKLSLRKDASGVIYVTYSGGDQGDAEDYEDNFVVNTTEVPLNYIYRNDVNANVYVAEVTLEYRAARTSATVAVPEEVYFRYPNIYFLNVKLDEVNGIETNYGQSNFDSLTLDDIGKAAVPPVQNPSITNIITTRVSNGDAVDETSFTINYSVVATSVLAYLKSIYPFSDVPNLTSDDLDIYTNIYISENQDYMKNKFSNLLPEERLTNSYGVGYDASFGEHINLNGLKSSGKPAIDILRDDKVLRIENIKLTPDEIENIIKKEVTQTFSYKIDGLDPNMKYYVYIDLSVNNLKKDRLDTSILSSLLAVTTKDIPDVPSELDKVPPTPVLDIIKFGLDYATLAWNKITMSNNSGLPDSIEYEIIRLEDKQMDTKYLGTKENFEYTWNNFLPDVRKAGYKTIGQSVEKSDAKGIFGTVAPESELTYNTSGTRLVMDDKTLSPNTIYFYYIRTVREIDGVKTYSVWTRNTVTTSNTDGPRNLIIDTSRNDYDTKTEAYLKFEAPISDISKLDQGVYLEYSMQKDNGAWSSPVRMNATELKKYATNADSNGYRTFWYKVTGLSPGTTYGFKVRMIDTKGNISLYSNIDRVKTDVDQDDYDDDELTDDYEELIDNQILEALNENYWVLKDKNNIQEILYRESKVDGLLSGSDKTLNLVDADPLKENIYYIPANMLIKLNNQNYGIRVMFGDVEIYLSPKTVNDMTNDAFLKAKADVNKSNINSIYFKLKIDGSKLEYLEGEKTLTDNIYVDMNLVGGKDPSDIFEDRSYNYMITELYDESFLEDEMKKINEMIKDGDSSEEIAEYVAEVLADKKRELLRQIDEDFNDEQLYDKYVYPIYNLDNNMSISFISTDGKTQVAGYSNVKDIWVSQMVTKLGNKYVMYSKLTGSFIFVGKKIVLGGITELEGGDRLTDIIIKYGLDDYLGSGNTFKLDNPVTNNMLVGTVARFMGASRGQDPQAFLKSKNITVSSRTLYQNTNYEEVISLLMEAYEARTNTNLETITIRNYGNTANVKNISKDNLKKIQVAYELGILTDKNLNVKNPLTVREFLIIIKRIDDKIKL